jgi:outer membrane protein OmpA-like peptidoglycan-associated protein
MTRIKSSLFIATAAALTLASCTDPGYVTGDKPDSKTKQGAIIGGLLGGFIGATRDGADGKDVAIGAAIGAIAGAAVGNTLDEQKKDLENSLQDDSIQIKNTGSQLIVVMPQGILFATDSAAVKPSLQADISALAANLQRYPNSTITIYGHTDNTGSAAHNLDLSQRRANAVRNALSVQGVAGSRIASVGAGEDSPVASNLTMEGRAANRRVEIVINPTK